MRMPTKMSPRSLRNISARSPAKASRFAAVFLFALAACSSVSVAPQALVPGQSTLDDVRTHMGKPAQSQPGPNGETTYWYPQLPWGHVSYAVRVGADDRVVDVEQRLTEQNIRKIVIGQTTIREVHDLLGPAYMPQRYTRMERDVW